MGVECYLRFFPPLLVGVGGRREDTKERIPGGHGRRFPQCRWGGCFPLAYGLLALSEEETLEVYTSVSKASPSSIVGILNCTVAMVVSLWRWSSGANGGQLKIPYCARAQYRCMVAAGLVTTGGVSTVTRERSSAGTVVPQSSRMKYRPVDHGQRI